MGLCTLDSKTKCYQMDNLRLNWRWKPDPDVDYYYPSKRDWFDMESSRGKRIADTKNVP